MPVLYLTEDDVRSLLDMPLAIDVVEEAFRQLAAGNAQNAPRQRVRSDGVMLHTLSAAAGYLGLVGYKAYTTTAGGANFLVSVYDDSGALLALIEADFLGQLRTGAASGVATEFMARPDAQVVGLFGTGTQARTQLHAVCAVRKIARTEVYGRDPERTRAFCDEMSELCRTEVVPVRVPDQVATDKDIVITATSARTPLFDGHALTEGTHLNVIGSNFLNKAEVDLTTIRRADVRVCDSRAQCQLEAGDFVAALEDGSLAWSQVHELAEVVSGRATARPTPESITLFKSVGLAIEDLALAGKLLDLARAENLGREIPLYG